MTDDNRLVYVNRMARLIAENDGLDQPPKQARRIWDEVIAPLLWLHAETGWRLEMERLAHSVTVAMRDELTVEAAQRRREVEFEANGHNVSERPPTGHRPVDSTRCECGETIRTVGEWFDHWRQFLVCACVPAKEAGALAAAGFEPIQCAVHPSTRLRSPGGVGA